MKKLLSILCAFLLLFACVGCNKSENNDPVLLEDLNIEWATSLTGKSATIKVRPTCDVVDLNLIVEAYCMGWYDDREEDFILQTKIISFGDLTYGEEYIKTFELSENDFTQDFPIFYFEFDIKSGTKSTGHYRNETSSSESSRQEESSSEENTPSFEETKRPLVDADVTLISFSYTNPNKGTLSFSANDYLFSLVLVIIPLKTVNGELVEMTEYSAYYYNSAVGLNEVVTFNFAFYELNEYIQTVRVKVLDGYLYE